MKRIVVIGSTGSGKTTLGAALAKKLNATVCDLDDLHWMPDWVERDDGKFRDLVERVAAGDRWVVTGNYSVARDRLWPRADTIVWLDYSFLRTAYQLLRRTIRRSSTGEPCCNGNRETWLRQFGRDSILLWLLKSYWHNRERLPLALKDHETGKHIVILRSPKETERWLHEL